MSLAALTREKKWISERSSLGKARGWEDALCKGFDVGQIFHAPPNLALLSTYWKHEGMRDQQHPGSLWRKIQIASSSTTLPLSLRESCFATDYATYSLRGFRVVGISCWPVAAWVEGFKQMGFEVTAKTTPVQHSSLQIEVVTYESGKLGKCCMKCLHCQFWRRDPIKDSTSAKGRSSYGWYSTISVAPRMEGWLWLLVTVARLHWLWSVHLRPKDSARDSVNKKEACSLQMVIMLKRRVAMAFARPSVHTSKAAWWVHAKCGSEWFPWRLLECFPGCKFTPSAASPLDLDWSCFWRCPSQTVERGLGSAIDMSLAGHVAGVWPWQAGWPANIQIANSSIELPLELNDAWKLFSPWILYRKHLARYLFGICCILLGQRIVPNRDRVVQKRWSCKVVGRDQFSQGDPGLCWGRSAFPIVDLTFHGQWHSFGVLCQPFCSGSFAWLGSHPSLATRKDATVKVVLATWHKWSAKRQVHKNHNFGTATS